MLVIYRTTHTVYDPDKALVPNLCTIRRFEDGLKLGVMGKAYLRSIIEAESKHVYANVRNLGLSLIMRDKLMAAAETVLSNVTFGSPIKLDRAFWQPSKVGDFDCRTNDYARAVDELVKPQAPQNCLECGAMSHVAALVALKEAVAAHAPSPAVGKVWFNQLIQAHVDSANKRRSGAKQKVKFGLRIPSELLQTEDLVTTGRYKGDWAFRPGDLMAIVSGMPETGTNAQSRLWSVENGVCVSWKVDGKGQPIYTEPLFVGAGITGDGDKPAMLTEAELKEAVFQATIAAAKLVLPPYEDKDERMKYFSIKTLDKERTRQQGKTPPGRRDTIPDLELATIVSRIAFFGGRNDISA